jgi:hypothetical protein
MKANSWMRVSTKQIRPALHQPELVYKWYNWRVSCIFELKNLVMLNCTTDWLYTVYCYHTPSSSSNLTASDCCLKKMMLVAGHRKQI